ncbi:MAG: recombinase family protein [Acidobacteria bacterium]|nr:recombinase family protein [Acidobacteriota bacterium]
MASGTLRVLAEASNAPREDARRSRFVAYYRVSTVRQGQSGLGLEAQRTTVRQFLDGGRWKLIGEHTEVESGKVNDRPMLAKALHQAKVTGARLVIAKLDRLSRNAAFLLALRDSGVRFVSADMPDANELTIGIMASVAQHERELISERTKAALAEARKRLAAQGRRLGNPNGARVLQGRGNVEAVQAARAKAQAFAETLRPVLEDAQASGATSNQALARALNEREITNARGGTGQWTDTTVARLRARLATPRVSRKRFDASARNA